MIPKLNSKNAKTLMTIAKSLSKFGYKYDSDDLTDASTRIKDFVKRRQDGKI